MKKAASQSCNSTPPSELDAFISCPHTKRCLLKAGVTTIAQLMSLSEAELLSIRGIGPVIAGDIRQLQARLASSDYSERH